MQTGEYVLRLSATDGVFSNSDQATFQIISRPFDAWRATNFSLAELLDESISGPAADPDHDGLPNFAEYFYAHLPKLYDAASPWRVRIINNHLQMVWIQRADVPDVSVAAERADCVEGPWRGGDGLVEQWTAPGDAPLTLEVTAQIRLPAVPARSQFLRMRLGLLE